MLHSCEEQIQGQSPQTMDCNERAYIFTIYMFGRENMDDRYPAIKQYSISLLKLEKKKYYKKSMRFWVCKQINTHIDETHFVVTEATVSPHILTMTKHLQYILVS